MSPPDAPVGPALRAGRVDAIVSIASGGTDSSLSDAFETNASTGKDGSAPSSPRRVKIVDVVHVNTATPEAFEGRRRYISTGAIDVDHIDESGVELWGFEDRPSRANLAPDVGDVLFAKMQATRKTYVVCNSEKGSLFSTGFYALKPHAEILDNGYLWHFLNSDQFLNAKDKECHGVTQKALNGAGLSKLTIPLPPLPAQREIAAELDRICELKRTAEKLVEKYQQLVKSRFVEMFGTDGATETPPSGECGVSSHHKYPIVTVGDVFQVGGPKRIHQSEWQDHGVPFLKISDLSERLDGNKNMADHYISRERYEELKAQDQTPAAGDVLVTARGTLGRYYVVKENDEFYFQDGMITWLSHKSDKIDLAYFLNAMKSDDFRRQYEGKMPGSTVAYLSIAQLAKLKLPLPPIGEQRQFASFVAKVDKLEFAAKRAVEKLDLLYRSKLQEHFG